MGCYDDERLMSYYTKDNKQYKSVTTILGEMFPFDDESFKKWCKKEGYDPEVVNILSTSMGSKVSDWIDNRYRGLEFLNPPVIGGTEKGLYEAVQSFLKDKTLLSTEQVVFCDKYMYAGTYDGIVEWNGKRYLMDWKTYGAWRGKYKRDKDKLKKVRLQLSMYKYALDEDLPIALVVFKGDGTFEIEEFEEDPSWQDYFI